MSALTGNAIQSSYQGLLKTENNAALPGGQTWITDGIGNRTGLFFWKDYSTMGISNNGTPLVSPFIDSQNTNFNVFNSPMGSSGNNNLIFSDVNGNRTWGVVQNRFGGVQYDTAKAGQSHYFTNSGDGAAVIRVNSFNNVNNSDNWYSGYQNSVSNLSFDSGTRDLTLSRTDNTDLIVNIPGGGGGGGVTHRTDQFITFGRYDGGNGGNFTFFNNTTIFIPIWLSSGTLSGAAVWNHGVSATPNAVNLSLWTAGSTASSIPGGGYGAPSVLIHNFGNVDTSASTGLQEITGASVQVDEGLHYMAIGHLGSWDTSFKVFDETQTGRGQLHYVVDDANTLGLISTTLPVYYDSFSNTQLASTTYASSPYTTSVSTSSAKCAMFLKYAS